MLSIRPCRGIYKIDPSLPPISSFYFQFPVTPFRVSYSSKVSTAITSSKPSRTPATTAEFDNNDALVSKPSLRLNPPATTRPPPLELPVREPSQYAFKYYFNLGRAYLTFYKTGLKNVYTNYQLSRSLASQISSLSPEEALRVRKITRAEWLTMKRSRADIIRLPLFGLVFLICGEFTPLVVLVMSGVVPRSLWIPKQVDGAREKLEGRRRAAFRNADPVVERSLRDQDADALKHKAVILHIGRNLGLYSNLWDRMGIPPTPVIRRRVKERMDLVDLDDTAIERDGGILNLEEEEARMAAEMRGIDIIGKKEQDVKKDLGKWLEARKVLTKKGRPITSLYLARPNAWSTRT